jgi:hypothetical protein
MESSLDFHKDLMIRQHLKELRASRPDLSFVQAWALVRKAHPDLFETEKDQPGELRQPQVKLGVQAKGSLERVQSADYILIRREDEGQLQRIEAALRWKRSMPESDSRLPIR